MRITFSNGEYEVVVRADSVRREGDWIVFRTDGVEGGVCARYRADAVQYVHLADDADGTDVDT